MTLFYPSVNAVGVSTQGNTGGNTGTSNGTWIAVGSNNITISQSTGTNNVHSLFFSGPTPGAGAAFSGGVSNIGNTSGNTGTVSNQVVFAGGNNITLSQSTNAGGATITVSAGNAGGDGYNFISAGTESANTTGTVVFSNSNRVSFGMSNNSVVTASAEPPIWSHFAPFQGSCALNQVGNGTLMFAPVSCPQITVDRLNIFLLHTNSSNSTGSLTASFYAGIFTKTQSSLSLATSGSASAALTFSGTVNNSLNNSLRLLSVPIAASISQGQYWIGFFSRTTTGGTNASLSNLIMSSIATVYYGSWGQPTNATNTLNASLGFGHYSASTSQMPNSVAFSQIQGQAGVLGRSVPYMVFASGSL